MSGTTTNAVPEAGSTIDVTTVSPTDHRVRSLRIRRDLTGLAFVTPYLTILLLFGLGPAGYSVYRSFIDDVGGTGFGVENYARVLGDFRFWPALTHVGVYLAIWLPVMVIGVLALALMLHDRPGRTSSQLRLVYFLPGAVAGSASVLLWYSMLEPSISPFRPALNALGFENAADVFRTQNLTVIFALIAFTIGAGMWIVIMYGALQNIPVDVMEAAAIDGCGPVRAAWFIKLPLIRKYVLYMIILSFANGVQLFVEPQLIYGVTRSAGSPWWSPNQFAYALAFQSGDFGSAAVLSLLMLVVCAIGAIVLISRTDFLDPGTQR